MSWPADKPLTVQFPYGGAFGRKPVSLFPEAGAIDGLLSNAMSGTLKNRANDYKALARVFGVAELLLAQRGK